MKVSKKTAEATWESVNKWLLIWQGTGADYGRANCPLCALYIYKTQACSGCPVEKTVDATHCRFTPYEEWEKIMERDWPNFLIPHNTYGMADTEELFQLAEDEYRFLVGVALSLELEE